MLGRDRVLLELSNPALSAVVADDTSLLADLSMQKEETQ